MIHKRAVTWTLVTIGIVIGTALFFALRYWRPRASVLQGAVFQKDSDPRKELPIAGAQITAIYRGAQLSAQSDSSGYFRIAIPGTVLPGDSVQINIQNPGFDPFSLRVPVPFRSSLRRLVVAAMQPEGMKATVVPTGNPIAITNLRIRYTVNSEREDNVGSAARTFEVINKSNIPCRRQRPCSPDGNWKATTGSIQMDAGEGNEFRDARASCIAGPCPFTNIDSSGFAHGGRIIVASASAWSDTVTFLLQAEVFHTNLISEERESYPVIFGDSFNFSVPPTAEGTSLVAELNGTEIVFPLSPEMDLSWAACQARNGVNAANSSVYQCELKAGYRF